MKTSIISTIVLALVASAEGCAIYGRCRCQTTDGGPVNGATQQACDNLRENVRGSGEGSSSYLTTTDEHNATWCNYGRRGKHYHYLNNCHFRELCAMFGATGPDSWCENKHD